MLPRVIAVSGGKGGTGKSFVALNIAIIMAGKHKVLLADLDVEEPNDYIMLGLDSPGECEFVTRFIPRIDYSKCTCCARCTSVCDVGALIASPGKPPFLIPRLCSGCKACLYSCPSGAIRESAKVIGRVCKTIWNYGGITLTLFTAILIEGEEHIPPMVVEAKRRLRSLARNFDVVIVDTGAGAGSKITLAIKDADVVVAVTEPTLSAIHDLEAILSVANKLGKRTVLVVNKAGLCPVPEEFKNVVERFKPEHILYIPFSREVIDSITSRTPLVLSNPSSEVASKLRMLVNILEDMVGL